jgi:hypothetical protein
MGSTTSTRWKDYTKRQTVESCKRVNAREAPHVGAATTTTSVAATTARRLWCLCECGRRVAYLYRLPDEKASAWKCRICYQLTNRTAQEKGTRAAFEAWLTIKRWNQACELHSATKTMYERMAELWGKNVAPYDWAKLNDQQRTELLQFYASPEVVRQLFAQKRWEHSGEVERMAQATGAQIKADVWEAWKRRNRPRRAKK